MNVAASPTLPHAVVTADSIDPDFNQPYIEIDENRLTPVPHRYVHGGFRGTGAVFSFYFPPADQYQRRFFHNTYPMATSSDIGPFPIAFEVAMGDLGFTMDSGAYYVQANNGGVFRAQGADPAAAAYRINAATAKFSRIVAAQIYGDHRPYGYLFGGSGGAYQTMGAAENTSGIWDGFLPFVPGCNHAIPSMFTVRMHALRVLRQRNKFPAIAAAAEPGGSGDPYAGLNEEEAAALKEATEMGFPLRGWYGHETMNSGYFSNIAGMMPIMDPTYADDFWSKPGYLGADPQSSIHAARFQFETSVTGISEGFPLRIELAALPGKDCADAHLVVLSGAATGASLPIEQADGRTVTLIGTADPAVAAQLRAGDKVRIDNSWPLALQTYHRHQIPSEETCLGWHQFRDAAGKPLYPQRDVLIGPTGTANAAGAVLNGHVHGKTLVLAAMMDIDSFPWQADWYRAEVKAALGPSSADNFALLFIDHAHHENPQTALARTHVVSYGGALQQGLRDLAAWVEQGIKPSESVYKMSGAQVEISGRAAERRGIQPTVEAQAHGSAHARVAVGEAVAFTGAAEAPPDAGKIVAAEWDFEGEGLYPNKDAVTTPQQRVVLSATHKYTKPGTYFAVLRATSQREGDAQTPYARIQNIARVRITVS